MPKLSEYVAQKPDLPAAVSSQEGSPAPLVARNGAAVAPQQQQQQQQQKQQQLQASIHLPTQQEHSVPLNHVLAPQHGAAAAKLQADFAKRLREHGPRTFRWPDGSLRPECPPPNPYAVADRQRWAHLVQHCRTHGGDRQYERLGHSLRYCINVPHEQHAAYMASIGLRPETHSSGGLVGAVPGLPRPLDDPEHCFNSFYKQGAEAVFKDARGRLL